MTSSHTRSLATLALVTGLGLGSSAALAVQQGDILVRVGVAHVAPTGDSDIIPTNGLTGAGARVEADSGTSLGLNFTYMATDNIGVQLLAAWPFKHDIEGAGALAGIGKVGETKHLPPTVTAQWHFAPQSTIRPFVGVGVNYTNFFSEDTTGALAGQSLKLDDSWGLAGELGVDIDIGNNWFVSGQVWYMDIDTEATVAGAVSFDVHIDPWVYMIGIGTKY
ncbi:MAG: OmpW family protein [Guyparkeria sp.]